MMKRILYLLPHALALCVSVGWYLYTGDSPRVFLYACMFVYAAELLTMAGFMRLSAFKPETKPLLELLTRRPDRGQVSAPVVVEGKGPGGLGAYFIVLAVIAFFSFILANVNSEKELDVTWAVLFSDVRGALLLSLIYWLETVFSRSITLDFKASSETNYGYNSSALSYFALAVLGGGVIMVMIQDQLSRSTGWAVVGPLLFFRHGIFIIHGLAAKDPDALIPDR